MVLASPSYYIWFKGKLNTSHELERNWIFLYLKNKFSTLCKSKAKKSICVNSRIRNILNYGT